MRNCGSRRCHQIKQQLLAKTFDVPATASKEQIEFYGNQPINKINIGADLRIRAPCMDLTIGASGGVTEEYKEFEGEELCTFSEFRVRNCGSRRCHQIKQKVCATTTLFEFYGNQLQNILPDGSQRRWLLLDIVISLVRGVTYARG